MQFLAHCHTHRITPSIVNIFYFLHCCDRCFVLMMIKNRRLCSFSSPARWLWHTTCSFLTCHEKIHIQFFPLTKNYSTLLVVVFLKYHREILPLILHLVARCLDNSGWFAEAAILVSQSSCRSSDIIFVQPLSLCIFVLVFNIHWSEHCIFKDTIRDRGSCLHCLYCSTALHCSSSYAY